MNGIETTIYFYTRNDAFIVNNILCGNMDFLWENIKPLLDDNNGILKEHENGLRPPLDDITINRLQSRIYGELDEAAKKKILKTAWDDIHNITRAMEPAKSNVKLYRTVITVDNDPRPYINLLGNCKKEDMIEFKNISSTSAAPGWGENSGHGFYRYKISVPKNFPILELDRFKCRNEEGEILLPPMKCRISAIYNDLSEKCRGVFDLDLIESVPINGDIYEYN
ncbi:MAG: hypothetical protein WCR95_05520 [Eubacteriales bacterium]